MAGDRILVLNAGSSSCKGALYQVPSPSAAVVPEPLWRGQLSWGRQGNQADLAVTTQQGTTLKRTLAVAQPLEHLEELLVTLWQGETQVIDSPDDIAAVGHRVVHGGQHYCQSVPVTAEVKQIIAELAPLAPTHNPANLRGIEILETLLTNCPQVAVFDTAFHTQMPAAAAYYPGPYEWAAKGLRRYGFHGISHQYVAHRAAQLLERDLDDLRLITCHLGNGCSLAAVHRGHSVNTTMGFTPLEGLMMGSRSGSLDPGLLIYLLRQEGYTADQVDQVLNRQSGLLGISGLSSDLRTLQEAMAQGHGRAQLAFDMFIHRLQTHIGAMLASLGGLDGLVFTAGIGEHSPVVWRRTCEALQFLNVVLEADLTPGDEDMAIQAPGSAVPVLVIHTQEEWAIARECVTVLATMA
ncbi:Acetate kinase [Halomicronema hongdechloris C2206]|uniref:Acetate kinase n=1 Tax=Halomicronema hongdechloris C2206 TaxID=1641165 RepID=A0A1Z3HLF3_9CYAN|nr:acetate kinase [Halomicronema hongdechloris]ASC71115.1 Acetate kinase [Halomicronema hongdechloris C2206]